MPNTDQNRPSAALRSTWLPLACAALAGASATALAHDQHFPNAIRIERPRPTAPAARVLAERAAAAQGDRVFSIVGLPDTQNYSELYPEIFLAQTEWVVTNAPLLDVGYVSHYGDVVQNADQIVEWESAKIAMDVLFDSDLVYGVTPGNHDITPAGVAGSPYIPSNYVLYYGPETFAEKPWYGGGSPSGMSSWQTFERGGVTFLTLHLECDTPVRELAWAQGVLDAHPDLPVILTTHRYLQDAEDYTSGVPLVASGRYPSIWYAIEGVYAEGGIQANVFFDWFVRRNTNVFLVNCGHFHEEYRQTSTNVAGRPVHEVLADFQDDPNGGDGWLRVMTFDLDANEIAFETYSPTLDQVRTADESRFTLPVAFETYAKSGGFLAFQQGINGYAGTLDTWIDEARPDATFGEDGERISDDDTMNSFFSDDRGQALIGFDGVVGDGAGEIPPGATITRATLAIDISDDIDTPLFDPDFFLHRVLVPWDETSTWNSLGGGLSGGELSPVIGVFSGDNDPDSDSLRRLDVTSTVQAWVNGEPNHGFAILPEIISGNDDGIAILTSESSNPILRPRLEVEFEIPAPSADLNGDGTVDGADLAILLGNWSGDGVGDLDGDGVVGGADLAIVLGAWG